MIFWAILYFPLNAFGLECFTCSAKSVQECRDTGEAKLCNENQEVCQVHQRKRHGVVYRVRMGCKQHRACNNNFGRNFAFNASVADGADQCQPEATGAGANSVCRQCCDQIFGTGTLAAECGLDLLSQNEGNGTDRAGWEEDLALHELKSDSTGGGNHTHAATGKSRREKFKLLDANPDGSVFDPNDSRYNGTLKLTDYIRDPNDSRYDPDDPRHNDEDYSDPTKLGWH